jgi:multiple sugar transport system permease protein
VATAGVSTFTQVYTEFFFSFLMTGVKATSGTPIMPAIYNIGATDATLAAAASVLALFPVALLVLFASERVIEGLGASAGYQGGH